MRSFEEVLAQIADVDGWMTPGQAGVLYRAAAAVAPGGRIVEIGSFRGRSTVVLASASAEGVEVVAIDPHAGNDRGPQEIDGFVDEASEDFVSFHRTLDEAGVAARVRHVRAPSADAHAEVDGPIDLLYVDGAHRYAPARADIRDWGRRVVPGGTLVIHDSFASVGVTLAITRELFGSSRYRYVGRSRSLAEYRADLGPGWACRARNALRQLAELPWFVRNVGIKVMIVLRLSRVLRAVTGRTPEWPY